MRILFVTPYYVPALKFGGPPLKIHALAKGLRSRGHELQVITFDHDRKTSGAEKEIEGVAVQHLPWIGRGLKQIPLRLSDLRYLIETAEIVHCYGLYNLICPIAAFVANRRRRPFVIEPLGMYPPRASSLSAKRIYNLLLTKWMLWRAAAVVATSEAELPELQSITERKKVIFRRNGIDLSEFAVLPSGRDLRERWSVSPIERIVLYIGRISPIKNLEQLVLAFEKAAITNTRLVLVGPLTEPDYEAKLRRLIAARKLDAKVLLAGPLYEKDQRAALATADLFVLPSLNESFGNAAAEAVAAGVPVLLTETCGVASLIDGRAGLAVPLGIDSLAEGLRTMFDPERRKAFTGRTDEVKSELSWDEPIEQTEKLYRRIVAEHHCGQITNNR